MSDYASETFEQMVDRVFQSHDEISYIAALDDRLNIIAQRGFVDLHPSLIDKFHIHAVLFGKMCTMWSDSFGKFSYTCVSFNSKADVMVILSGGLYIIAVVSHDDHHDLKASIAAHFY